MAPKRPSQPAQRPSQKAQEAANSDGSDSGSDASSDAGASSMSSDEESREKLVHLWCKKQLSRCVKRLQSLPDASPFLVPIPWQELGLSDYPEIVKEPVDLQTIAERLMIGDYDDDDGLIDPDFFWEDVQLIWKNCKQYYEEDKDAEPHKMAEKMEAEAAHMEEDFWQELEDFEASLGDDAEEKAGVTEVAAGHVEDLVTSFADWWYGTKPEDQPPPVEVPTRNNGKKVVIETVVGKGLIKMTLQNGIPTHIEDRELLINDTVDSLARACDVSADDIEVDWDLIFKDCDMGPHGRIVGNQLDVAYSVRLDDKKRVEQVVQDFSIAKTKRTLQKDLGSAVLCTVTPMKISKISRRTLGDHFFDVILELCDYDASRDLLEIEDDLTEALRDVLDQIHEIDEDEKHATGPIFPEANKKKALHAIRDKAPRIDLSRQKSEASAKQTTPRSQRMSISAGAASKRRESTTAHSKGPSPATTPRGPTPDSLKDIHRMSLAPISKKDLMNNNSDEEEEAPKTPMYDYAGHKPHRKSIAQS